MEELKQDVSGCINPDKTKRYYIYNYKILDKIVSFLYNYYFINSGQGKTFQSWKYCFGTFLWNMICGHNIKESWVSYKKLIKIKK